MNNRLERCLRILILLQGGDCFDAGKLANALDVTRRTIFRDIAVLKELGLDVVYDADISSYCVLLVPSAASPVKARRLSTDQLADSVQDVVGQSDLSAVSQATVIRSIALKLASQWEAIPTASPAERVEGVPPNEYVSDERSGALSIVFEKLADKICFLTDVISHQRPVSILRVEISKPISVRVVEIKFTTRGWFVSYVTCSQQKDDSSPLTCSLGDFQIVDSNREI